MKIYTSYFAMGTKLPKDLVQISISLFPPKGYKGLCYKKIAPTRTILSDWKETHDEKQYVVDYNKFVLSSLRQDDVYKDLYRLSGGKDCVLLCFEKSDNFCHRHLFAEWMDQKYYKVEEFKF